MKPTFRKGLRSLCVVGIASLVPTATALAQNPMARAMRAARSSSSSSSSMGKTFAFSIPVLNAGGQTTGHAEFNLFNKASISLEASALPEREELSEDKMEETGESLVTSGQEAALLISRYSQPTRMAGFYWTMGAGYRQVAADWTATPDPNDPGVDYALTDENEKLNHQVNLKGVTGHARLGYNYVAQEWPFMIGIYAGLRHFQAGVENVAKAERGENYAPVTDQEAGRLRRRYMTSLALGIPIGMSF